MTRYGFDYTPAQAGQIADASLRDVISLPAHVANDDIGKSDGPIAFGYPVQALVTADTNEAYVKVVNSLSNKIIGIATFSHCRENEKSNQDETASRDAFYLNKDVVSVLSKGRIWVYVSVDVKEGDIAYIIEPDNGDGITSFSNVYLVFPKEIGIFMSNSITVGGRKIAILEFDLSAHAVERFGL